MADERIGLHSLSPRPARAGRRSVGRGEGSGTGKTAGRGHKGYGARSAASAASASRAARRRSTCGCKLRGPHMKKSMPFEKFRTRTQPVNLDDLEARFDAGAEVATSTACASGLATKPRRSRQGAGRGELSKALTVHAHGFSKTARERIEAAGGTCQVLEDWRTAGCSGPS